MATSTATTNLKYWIGMSTASFTQPRTFFRALPSLPLKICLIPLSVLTFFNAAWILGIALRTRYVVNAKTAPVIDFASNPLSSVLFMVLVIILIFLAVIAVIATEAALLQVLTQSASMRTPTHSVASMRFRSFFILISHAHVPYMIETGTLGIIINGMLTLSNLNLVINLDEGENILTLPINTVDETLLRVLAIAFILSLLLAMGLMSLLIHRVLFANDRTISKGTSIKVLLPFNIVKILLIIIVPIMLL